MPEPTRWRARPTGAAGRRGARLAAVLLAVLVAVPLLAGPAAAHGASGQEASNYLTTLTSPPEPAPGVTVRLVESGARLELTSREVEAEVQGYDGEPYLRVGPDGVLVNTRSPASVRNAGIVDPGGIPAGTDPDAEPLWQRVTDEPTARWFEHRARWARPEPPAAVVEQPEQRQVVREWVVPVTAAGTPVPVAGTVEWVPGPSPLPWWLLAAAAAGAVTAVALLRRHAARVLAGVTAGCVLVSVAHSALSAAEAAGGAGAQLAAFATGNVALLAGWVAGAVGAVQLWRHRPAGLYVAAFAGAVVAVLGGLLDAAAFGSSQVPAAGPPVLGRLTTALSLGLGLGLVAAAVLADDRVIPADGAGPAGPGAAPARRSGGGSGGGSVLPG